MSEAEFLDLNRTVIVASGYPEEFVTPIAKMVGIDYLIATRIRTDPK